MFTIERTDFGLKIVFAGRIEEEEWLRWLEESSAVLGQMSPPFHVYVDMRELEPLDAPAQKVLIRGQHAFRRAGMDRSAVVVEDPATRQQFERMARQSGIHVTERYVDVQTLDNWHDAAMAWLLEGVEPKKS